MGSINETSKNSFVVMLVGQTGRGKSSTINSLLGAKIARENADEPETKKVRIYNAKTNGVKFRVVDTPGLCDALPEEQNDDKYIGRIKSRVQSIDCLWFVSRLDENRVTSDEKRAIRIISAAFDADIWKHAVIVFTFAGKVEKEDFAQKLETRTRLIRKEIEACAGGSVASEVQSVAVDNKSRFLPDGKEWLGELYTQTFLRFKTDSAAAFFLATADRVNVVKNGEHVPDNYQNPSRIEINLTEQQAEKIKDIVETSTNVGAVIGATLGTMVAGLPGTGVGTFVGTAGGAVVGFTIKLVKWLFG